MCSISIVCCIEVSSITPNKKRQPTNNNHTAINTYKFLVDHSFFSAHWEIPKNATRWEEYTSIAIAHHINTIPRRMFFIFLFDKPTKKRATGLEPVQAELKSAMLHQLHHARITLSKSQSKNIEKTQVCAYRKKKEKNQVVFERKIIYHIYQKISCKQKIYQ